VLTRVAGVLLAAGAGSRLGQPKALVKLGDMTLAERGVALLRSGGADPVLVVTGAVAVSLDGVRLVPNPGWRTGIGSSVRVALAELSGTDARDAGPAIRTDAGLGAGPDVGAAVIALADQPLVGAEAVRRLIQAYRDGASVAVAAYHGRARNPVLIAAEHWPSVIATATGDAGARAFLRARPDLVTLIECGDTGSPDDIDTPEDLERVRALTCPLTHHVSVYPTSTTNRSCSASGTGMVSAVCPGRRRASRAGPARVLVVLPVAGPARGILLPAPLPAKQRGSLPLCGRSTVVHDGLTTTMRQSGTLIRGPGGGRQRAPAASASRDGSGRASPRCR
jgi:CTP:molybdopterin cytidylyltransferase MocA